MPDITPYRVYACRYGTREATRREHFIDPDAHPDVSMPMDYFVWVATNDERTIVIDTGYSAEVGTRRGRTQLRQPADALRLVGIDPAQVEDVVLTHFHYDHVGTLADFPRARFHANALDMEYVTGPSMHDPHDRGPYEVADVTDLVRLLHEERLSLYSAPAELARGLSIHHLGGHTPGIQPVRVWTQRGWVVLASDVSHYYENMESGRPFAITHDREKAVAAFSALRALADSPQHIIPGHDPRVLERYPAPSPDLEGIIARLDVPPRE